MGTIRRALTGVLAAGLSLGVAELVSVLIGSGSAPFSAVGAVVVDNTPTAPREWAIQTFGTHDKAVLFICMALVIGAVAAFAGIVESQQRRWGAAIFVVGAVLGGAAVLSRPGATFTYVLPVATGLAAGLVALRKLTARADEPDGRREFLIAAGVAGAAGLATGFAARILGAHVRDVAGERAAVTLPRPVSAAAVLPETDIRVAGLSSFITGNDDFYRIDTALTVPQVAPASWSLRVYGMVNREIRLSFDELLRLPLVERTITLCCVSNPVGGPYIGNATWLGYPLRELLAQAQPQPDADMVLSRSVDSWTAGTPLDALTDARDALLAVGMNGEPLPVDHGFPARLVVPGLYGYVSATKWVTSLEVTRFDKAQGYWTPRGWSARGPVKTGIRIDTPGKGSRLAGGRVPVAGVAWAQGRGIAGVEVQVDDGDWQPATLSAQQTKDTWRQWVYYWTATSGTHTLRARAVDGTGQTQTAQQQDVLPDGATGYPAVVVRVG